MMLEDNPSEVHLVENTHSNRPKENIEMKFSVARQGTLMWKILQVTILLVLATTVQSRYYHHGKDHKYHDTQWDYLIFAQQWPQSACLQYESKNYSNKCNIHSNMTTWTVHGLWPQKDDGGDISFCNKTYKFNEADIESIEPLLLQYWPSIFSSNARSFWSHEWSKHGTCAAEDNLLQRISDYFGTGLNLIRKYNMLDVLAKAGVTPNTTKTYSLSDITNGVKTVLGVSAKIQCAYIKHKPYLLQMEISFDKGLNLVDLMNPTGSSCPEDGILYQPIQYPGLKMSYNVRRR